MNTKRVILDFVVGIAVQAGVYLYLDKVLFAKASDFKNAGTNQQEALGFGVEPKGQSYYSFDKRFMATIVDDQLAIYEAGKKGEPQRINLHGKKVSFFEWLPDSNLAIIANYGYDNETGIYDVQNAQYDPVYPEWELDTPIDEAPEDS